MSDCNHYSKPIEKEDRYYIDSEIYNNCVFCAINAHKGKISIHEIAKMLGLSFVRVYQIEQKALLKFKKRMLNLNRGEYL